MSDPSTTPATDPEMKHPGLDAPLAELKEFLHWLEGKHGTKDGAVVELRQHVEKREETDSKPTPDDPAVTEGSSTTLFGGVAVSSGVAGEDYPSGAPISSGGSSTP